MMSAPFAIPLSVVRTPLALFTAVRVIEPVTGIDCKNEPNKLHIPNANISCVASSVRPLATKTTHEYVHIDFDYLLSSTFAMKM